VIDAAIDPSEPFARHLDEADPTPSFREAFQIPRRRGVGAPGQRGEAVYLCGNSLGLQPRAARELVSQELDDWANLGVDAHFDGMRPWYPYHEALRAPLARLVGAKEREVVAMNSLTVNLHLMMVSFYRPTRTRYRVLIESPAFPSDTYAVQSHLRARGVEAADAVVAVGPRAGEHLIREEDVEETLDREGDSIALVMLGGVNFLTGQALDMARITRAAHARGCVVGFDLAHAAGNLPLQLHKWDVDFAVWCSYKYLNSGPGAVAGCFVHERHATSDLPRYGGWWGNDPATRFRMHLNERFVPVSGADGWQVSNPPILAMAPLRASLDLFDRAGMGPLRERSVRLTAYTRALIERDHPEWFEVITPREQSRHGCQVSILVHDRPRDRFRALVDAGVVCDFREPNVIRAAPAPLYNTFGDCWAFARALTAVGG
jgi:kynureninase